MYGRVWYPTEIRKEEHRDKILAHKYLKRTAASWCYHFSHLKPATSMLAMFCFIFQRRLELYRYRKRLFARLRRTAEEAKRWTRLVEIRAASGLELTDPQPIYPSLASFTGTRTRFLLKEKEVSLPFCSSFRSTALGDDGAFFPLKSSNQSCQVLSVVRPNRFAAMRMLLELNDSH